MCHHPSTSTVWCCWKPILLSFLFSFHTYFSFTLRFSPSPNPLFTGVSVRISDFFFLFLTLFRGPIIMSDKCPIIFQVQRTKILVKLELYLWPFQKLLRRHYNMEYRWGKLIQPVTTCPIHILPEVHFIESIWRRYRQFLSRSIVIL